MIAKSLRDRAESRRERARLDDLRDERLERQLQGHMARAEGGDEKSLAWLKRRHDGIMLARAYGAGMGRKHAGVDGWSEADGKYLR